MSIATVVLLAIAAVVIAVRIVWAHRARPLAGWVAVGRREEN